MRCLNPCFTGSWVLRKGQAIDMAVESYGLNPCFTGSWVLSSGSVNGDILTSQS